MTNSHIALAGATAAAIALGLAAVATASAGDAATESPMNSTKENR